MVRNCRCTLTLIGISIEIRNYLTIPIGLCYIPLAEIWYYAVESMIHAYTLGSREPVH
jgi:hypothetical protein